MVYGVPKAQNRQYETVRHWIRGRRRVDRARVLAELSAGELHATNEISIAVVVAKGIEERPLLE